MRARVQMSLHKLRGLTARRKCFFVGSLTCNERIRLLDIALLPEFQNRGVGTALLERLKSEAQNAGKALRHMVFVLNNNADRFYERLGFKQIEDFGAYKHMEWRK